MIASSWSGKIVKTRFWDILTPEQQLTGSKSQEVALKQ
jgi:hypothetical protein